METCVTSHDDAGDAGKEQACVRGALSRPEMEVYVRHSSVAVR